MVDWPGMRWLVDPTGTDPQSDVGALLTKHRVPESQIRVFANEKAAWSAAAAGEGVAPAIDHMVTAEVDRGVLARVGSTDMPVDLLLYVSSLEAAATIRAADKFVVSCAPPTPCRRCIGPTVASRPPSSVRRSTSPSGVEAPI